MTLPKAAKSWGMCLAMLIYLVPPQPPTTPHPTTTPVPVSSADTTAAFKSAMERQVGELGRNKRLASALHKYAYESNCEPGKVVLQREVAEAMIPIMLSEWNLADDFAAWLATTNVAMFSKDAWTMLRPFSKTLRARSDAASWDDSGAWPSLFDQYVAHLAEAS